MKETIKFMYAYLTFPEVKDASKVVGFDAIVVYP